MPYIGNDPVKNASVGTDQLKDDAVTNSKIIDDITFNTGSFSRVESTNYSGEGGALTGVATPASVTSSFAQKSAVSSSISEPAANVSGSSTSTGSFSSVVVADKVQGNLTVTGDLAVGGVGIGITHAEQWRLNTDLTGDASPMTNMSIAGGPAGYGKFGSSMTVSSGIFTFPSTGYWLIMITARIYGVNSAEGTAVHLFTTTNNSTYATACTSDGAGYEGSEPWQTTTGMYLMKVTTVANDKCRLDCAAYDNSNRVQGDANGHHTGLTFLKVGDL